MKFNDKISPQDHARNNFVSAVKLTLMRLTSQRIIHAQPLRMQSMLSFISLQNSLHLSLTLSVNLTQRASRLCVACHAIGMQ